MYLYLFENGEVGQSKSEPTIADKKSIEFGMLQVIRVVGGRFMWVDESGSETDVEASRVVGKNESAYHSM